MKRIYTLTLLLPIVLAACSGGETTVKQTENLAEQTTTIVKEETDGLPDTDLNGYNFTILNYDDTMFTWAENRIGIEEQNGELINDTIFERNNDIEERFNIVIAETKVSDVSKQLPSVVTAGDHLYDIAMLYDRDVGGFWQNGYIQSWDEIPYIRFDEPWWGEANQIFSIGDNQIAAVGDFSLAMHSRNYLYIFNKDICSTILDPQLLYDYVYDGSWTVDKLFEVGKQFVMDMNGDGVMDKEDRYGISGAVQLEYGALISGAGVRYVERDNNGNLYFNLKTNDNAVNVMQKVFDLHTTNTYVNFMKDYHSTDFDFFMNGHSMLFASSIKHIERFRDFDANIGYLPVPKYTEEQKEYHCLSAGGAVAVIPMTATETNLEATGLVLEALSWKSNRELLPVYIDETLKTKYTRDEDSVKMMEIILDSSFYDLGVSVWQSVTQSHVMEKVYLPMKDTIASTIDSMTKKVEAEIEAVADKQE